jgi:hypothetical protein
MSDEKYEVISFINSQLYILEVLCKGLGYTMAHDIISRARVDIMKRYAKRSDNEKNKKV